jgi:ABC-type sugar transport system ATPase subunit
VFLFDEPLSNLDAALRVQMRVELKRLHDRLETTAIYVTHDQVEAMTLGDRICVMQHGKVAQIGAPLDVYRRPANVFVARFLGSPPMNIVSAELDRVGAPRALAGGGGFALRAPVEIAAMPAGGAILLGFRPEDVALSSPETAPRALVQAVELLGAETIVSATLEGGGDIALRAPRDLVARPGECIGLAVAPDALHLFDPQTGAALTRPAL